MSSSAATISRIAVVTLSILLFEHCTTVTLTRITQQRADLHVRPSPALLVLYTEMLKLLMSTWLELTHSFGMGSAVEIVALKAAVCGVPWDTSRLSIPAFLYTVQNLAIYVALGNLEVVLFQVLYQLKLILTAGLSVLCLGRRLSRRQWLALVTLTVGVVTVELADGSTPSSPSPPPPAALATYRPHQQHQQHQHDQHQQHAARNTTLGPAAISRLHHHQQQQYDQHQQHPVRNATLGVVATLPTSHPHQQHHHQQHDQHQQHPTRNATLGVVAVLLAALLSSTAGVYFEAIIKTQETSRQSLWVRNVQLCVFTIPIAAVMVVAHWHEVLSQGLLLPLLDPPTALLIVLNASGGLIVAAAIKYGDNILKNFTTAFSVIFGTLISVVLFGFQLSSQFVTGALLVIASGYIYAVPASAPAAIRKDESVSLAPAKV
uniref:Sugar phosphate transporter domain-containing protein n=1 Tax=Haptolina brevifila TaxID=156173 RepID=A0A7S2FK18_9EUKA|mmetsp:Transcript_13587/g.27324  ORF Transcript_13587/g.27324 Transcript_13587/m.27324 type:complete len:433 (+) Transcript_13587:70-1368(+)